MDPEHLDNDIWMYKFRRGEESTLKEVFEVYGASLFTFANQFVNDRQRAEDIVAETFIKLWRQRESFVELQNIKAYLYVVTRNACRQYLKQINATDKKSIAPDSESQQVFPKI